MDMYQSEKNALEKLADAIPGLKGYREKEARRDTDKRLREYMAGRIEGVKKNLDEVKRGMVNKGQLQGLAEIDRLAQKITKVAGSIRYASYGYAGFFDQVKIQEAELDRIYQYDFALIADIEALEAGAKQNNPTDWDERINALETKIEGRKNIFVTAE